MNSNERGRRVHPRGVVCTTTSPSGDGRRWRRATHRRGGRHTRPRRPAVNAAVGHCAWARGPRGGGVAAAASSSRPTPVHGGHPSRSWHGVACARRWHAPAPARAAGLRGRAAAEGGPLRPRAAWRRAGLRRRPDTAPRRRALTLDAASGVANGSCVGATQGRRVSCGGWHRVRVGAPPGGREGDDK